MVNISIIIQLHAQGTRVHKKKYEIAYTDTQLLFHS